MSGLSKARADQEEVEAQEYAATIQAERRGAPPTNWKSLNLALIKEYGDAGLFRIKRRAWRIIEEAKR